MEGLQMKKVLFSVVLLLGVVALPAFAQAPRDAKPMAASRSGFGGGYECPPGYQLVNYPYGQVVTYYSYVYGCKPGPFGRRLFCGYQPVAQTYFVPANVQYCIPSLQPQPVPFPQPQPLPF